MQMFRLSVQILFMLRSLATMVPPIRRRQVRQSFLKRTFRHMLQEMVAQLVIQNLQRFGSQGVGME